MGLITDKPVDIFMDSFEDEILLTHDECLSVCLLNILTEIGK